MSHLDSDEFFANRGEPKRNYTDILLSVEKDKEKSVYITELKLARAAMEAGCKFVTNIDYCLRVIAATGWKSRIID